MCRNSKEFKTIEEWKKYYVSLAKTEKERTLRLLLAHGNHFVPFEEYLKALQLKQEGVLFQVLCPVTGKVFPLTLEQLQYRYENNIVPYWDATDNLVKAFRLEPVQTKSSKQIPLEFYSKWAFPQNGLLTPWGVNFNSPNVVWWRCKKCGYCYDGELLHEQTRKACPICTNRRVVEGFNDAATTQSWLSKFVSPKSKVKLTEVPKDSKIKVLWRCPDCGGDYELPVFKRATLKKPCPLCKEKERIRKEKIAKRQEEESQLLAEMKSRKENLAQKKQIKLPTTFEEAMKMEYSKLNTIPKDQITQGSNKEVYWTCSKCGIDYKMKPSDRFSPQKVKSRGKIMQCPYCRGYRVKKGHNDLFTVYPFFKDYWNFEFNEGVVDPYTTSRRSDKLAWFNCSRCSKPYQRKIDTQFGLKFHCEKCRQNTKISSQEQEVFEFLKESGVVGLEQSSRVVPYFELDMYQDSSRIAVEYHGVFWHTDNIKSKGLHAAKFKACKTCNITLFQIWEDDWLYRRPIVEKMLLNKFRVLNQPKIPARKTLLDFYVSKKEAEIFLNENHIQGFTNGRWKVGLRHNGNLVALMVLSRNGHIKSELNLQRYATSANVQGGFTKLLKNFIKFFKTEQANKPALKTVNSIITFSDNMVSDGGLYLNNGFDKDFELEPDYMYVIGTQRVHKFNYRKKRFREDPDLKFEEGLTEKELAELNGIPRVWDAGKVRWRYKFY